MIFKMFSTTAANESGQALAKIVVSFVPKVPDKTDITYNKKLNSAMRKLKQQIDWLKVQHRFNVYQKAKLGNTFRWNLLDAGYEANYAKDLTQWVLVQFNSLK